MKNRFYASKVCAVLLFFAFTIPTGLSSVTLDKPTLKPEELIAKHLESLGSPDALKTATSRVITGTALANFRQGGHGQIQGKAVLASQGSQNLFAMVFGTSDYPQEKMAFDGKRVTLSQIRPGVRTILGRFLTTNELALREGLIGGSLSASWPLLDMSSKTAKLQYDGLKKIDKRQLHALRYSAQKSSGLKVALYFDPETFQHVRTEYHQILASQVAANKPGESMQQEETRIDIIEEFSDFKAESKLTLPHTYKLQLSITGPSAVLYDWTLTFNQFEFGQAINGKEFNLESL